MGIVEKLQTEVAGYPGLALLVLIGSRARGDADIRSDWDFAVQWLDRSEAAMADLARDEALRSRLAEILAVEPEKVDIVDLSRAGLTMRAAVAEEGLPLLGGDTLYWHYFLVKTWRELEYWYWEQEHAA